MKWNNHLPVETLTVCHVTTPTSVKIHVWISNPEKTTFAVKQKYDPKRLEHFSILRQRVFSKDSPFSFHLWCKNMNSECYMGWDHHSNQPITRRELKEWFFACWSARIRPVKIGKHHTCWLDWKSSTQIKFDLRTFWCALNHHFKKSKTVCEGRRAFILEPNSQLRTYKWLR